jgi:hypothetical protein
MHNKLTWNFGLLKLLFQMSTDKYQKYIFQVLITIFFSLVKRKYLVEFFKWKSIHMYLIQKPSLWRMLTLLEHTKGKLKPGNITYLVKTIQLLCARSEVELRYFPFCLMPFSLYYCASFICMKWKKTNVLVIVVHTVISSMLL